MSRRGLLVGLIPCLLTGLSGCAIGGFGAQKCSAPPELSAVSLNPADREKFGQDVGIPFYLPKPLLIISKNFRNIEAPTVGLTGTAPIPGAFDDQSKFADLNARTNFNGLNGTSAQTGNETNTTTINSTTNTGPGQTLTTGGLPVVPGVVPGDGLGPDTFFTYQIVFVPDLSQKYGLKIRGGPGEMRAAMNLVNGWQFTGFGPFYMKDSATAQNILASGISARLGGQAAADMMNAAANLGKVLGLAGRGQGGGVNSEDKDVKRLTEAIAAAPLQMVKQELCNYAEIFVYEPQLLPDGHTEWRPIAQHQMNREYLGVKTITREVVPAKVEGFAGAPQSGAVTVADDPDVARAAVAGVFGLPVNSPALSGLPVTGAAQSGAAGSVPAGGVNQIVVDSAAGAPTTKEFNLFKFGADRARPVIQNRSVTTGTTLVPGAGGTPTPPGKPPAVTPGGAAQAGSVTQTPAPGTIINQPVFNQSGTVNPPPGPAPAIPPADPKVGGKAQ